MRKKLLIITSLILIAGIFTAYWFISQSQTTNGDMDATDNNILLKIDGPLNDKKENGKSPGEIREHFSYTKKDNSKIRYTFTDKNKKGMSFLIYYNNDAIVKGRTNKENNYELISTFAPPDKGDYRVTVVSDNGDGGEDYPISLLMETVPN